MIEELLASIPVAARVAIVFIFAIVAGAVRALSRRAPAKPKPRKIKEGVRPDDHRRRILIVEDSPEQGRVLARSLRDELPDVEFDLALSGEEGLVMLEVSRYAVAIVDVGLRGIGGATFVVRARRKHPDLAAVLVSGHAPEELREIAENCGAVAHFSKPLDAAEIATTLGPYLT